MDMKWEGAQAVNPKLYLQDRALLTRSEPEPDSPCMLRAESDRIGTTWVM